MEVLQVRGWRAVPNKDRGYDIHSPGFYDTFRGWAPTKQSAEEWLDESSGAAYDRLPAVREADLRVERGEPQKLRGFGYVDVIQRTSYYLGEKYLGAIQRRTRLARTTVLTYTDQHCVLGSDLRWLLKQNGYRLVT